MEWKGTRTFLKYFVIVAGSFLIGNNFNIISSYNYMYKSAINNKSQLSTSPTIEKNCSKEEGATNSLQEEVISASQTDEINSLKEEITNLIAANKNMARRQGRSYGRLIHDVTLPFNTTMFRPWLGIKDEKESTSSSNVVKSMLLLTSYGWNKEDQISALKYPRMLRERELYSGIVNHPLFHPTGWEDIQKNGIQAIRNNTNYYVFLDRMNCKESNYPKYGQGLENNTDRYFVELLTARHIYGINA